MVDRYPHLETAECPACHLDLLPLDLRRSLWGCERCFGVWRLP